MPQLTKAAGNALPVIFADGLLKVITRLADAADSGAFDLAAALLFVPNAGDLGEVSPYSSRSDWLLPRLRWIEFSEFTQHVLPALERSDQERTLALLLEKLNEIAAVARKLDLTRLVASRLRPRSRLDAHDVAGQAVEATSEMLARFGSVGVENARNARAARGGAIYSAKV